MLGKQKKRKGGGLRRAVSDISRGILWKNMANTVNNISATLTGDDKQEKEDVDRGLIQLKSGVASHGQKHKEPLNDIVIPMKQEDLYASVDTYDEQENLSPTLPFKNTISTAFSVEDLNAIFNIARENMDVDTTDDTVQNVDRSSTSLDSTPQPVNSMKYLHRELMNMSKDDTNPLALNLDTSNLSRTFENGEILNPRSPFTPEGVGTLSRLQMVCREMVMTERTYVNDLRDVIEGYIHQLKEQKDLDVESIFGNLEAVYEFNSEVLVEIDKCETEDNEIDPIRLAKVFCEKVDGFNYHYTCYCTNYPETSLFFSIIMQDPSISSFFVERQQAIGHALSLESYLLKPVQRILKYHLLFRDILKRYKEGEDGYEVINTAFLAMSDVAEYINEMKRLHENAIKVQGILQNIIALDVPIDVYKTGRLVLENTFKVHGARGERYLYLFEKLLLICKKNDDLLHFKEKIECSNMLLRESMKEPLVFQVTCYDNHKICYSIVAKTTEVKKEWTQHLKRLILENHAALIPQTARQAILGPEEKSKSKYNSLPIQALDENIMRKGNRSANKENVIVAGVKRESEDKDSGNTAKRTLNSKAKEYLNEKRRNYPVLPILNPTPEKDKKSRWIRRHKHKPSLDSALTLDAEPELSPYSEYSRAETLTKTRSLESLKDCLRLQKNIENTVDFGILQDVINHDFEKPDVRCTKAKWISSVEKTSQDETSDVANETSDVANDDFLKCNSLEEVFEKELPEGDDERSASARRTSSVNSHTKGDVEESELDHVSPMNNVEASELDDVSPMKNVDGNEQMEQLERRLSILSDADNADTSIKDMVRKVSNAFNSSFTLPYAESPSHSNTVSRDLSILLGKTPPDKTVYRRSTGGLQNRFRTPAIGRSRSLMSFKESTCKEDEAKFEPASLVVLSPPTPSVESTDEDEIEWSADVDQVFDGVNAELGSLADSIASDIGKSNSESESTTEVAKRVAEVEVKDRAAVVDKRLREANVECGGSSTLNVEVKHVADRIKEYKKLIDAEKRMNTWSRKDPITMTEMIESLDSIRPTTGSSVYSYHRKRFSRPSSDFNQKSVVIETVTTTTVESFEHPVETYSISSNECSTPSLDPKEGGDIKKRTSLYFNAVNNDSSQRLPSFNDVFYVPTPTQELKRQQSVDEVETDSRKLVVEQFLKEANEILVPESKDEQSTKRRGRRRSRKSPTRSRTTSLPRITFAQVNENSAQSEDDTLSRRRRYYSESSSSTDEQQRPQERGRSCAKNTQRRRFEKQRAISRTCSNEKKSNLFHRSASVPRRAHLPMKEVPVDDYDGDAEKTWAPSKHCTKQSNVNLKIKQYFVNLQESAKASRSRPNLVLVGQYNDGSDTENDTSSDGRTSPHVKACTEKPDAILRGTVRSMIKKYASNYIFDK